jgi:Ca2+-binding RTX toxin-like protein
MASTSELAAIKNANPSLSIPGLDTSVGLQVASLASPQSLTNTSGIYYNPTQKIVVVYQDGITLSGIDLTGLSVMVQANNVTVSNCKFDGSAGTYALKVFAGYANATIDHCAFDGLKLDRGFEDFIVAQGVNTMITNNTFVDAPNDAIYIENGTVSHNAISGGGYRTGAHPDAIWIGKTTGPVTISDNVIDWRNPADSRAETNNAVRITGENGNVSDVTVTRNAILGGSTTVFVSDGPTQTHPTVGTVTNVQVTGNVVDNGRWAYLNLTDRPSDLVYTGNVLATGPAPAIADGANPQLQSLNHVTGSAIADSLSGSSEADAIVGGNGVDWISAWAGNDVILSGAGGDYLSGGAGADYFTYTSAAEMGLGSQRDRIGDFQAGVDKIHLAGLQDLPSSAAGASWHLIGWKYFTGTPLEIRTYLSGSNTVVAFDLDGDLHTDMEIELTGTPGLTAGDFLITATTPDFSVTSSFVATDPTVTIYGTTAANTLTGTASGEMIYAEAGNDIINAGAGDDVIIAGTGKDLLTGGAGRDRFAFETAADSKVGGSARDMIQDFTRGEDVIDLTSIDANANTTEQDAFSWIGSSNFSGAAGQLRFQFISTYTVVCGDTNGDKVADFEVGVAGNQHLASSDFLLGTLDIGGGPATPEFSGTPGDDRFTALSGYERIDAGGGVDTINFNFKLADATFTWSGNEVIVDTVSSHTILTGFEIYRFTDGAVNNNDGSRLIDDLFYYATYRDVWSAHIDAELHYNQNGWHERRDPNAFFSTSFYLAVNRDVSAAGVNPLTHFDQSGWKEGRLPSISFDTSRYLAANPDVAAAHIDPLSHFLSTGAGEGRQPVAATSLLAANGFDFAHYLQNNPDVAASGIDPFWHFQNIGWREGRNPNALFDTKGYLASYGDVAAAGVNPLDHYHASGWREERDPSPGFDTSAYLAGHPDVAAANIDPLSHYLQAGMNEGRSPFADGLWG